MPHWYSIIILSCIHVSKTNLRPHWCTIQKNFNEINFHKKYLFKIPVIFFIIIPVYPHWYSIVIISGAPPLIYCKIFFCVRLGKLRSGPFFFFKQFLFEFNVFLGDYDWFSQFFTVFHCFSFVSVVDFIIHSGKLSKGNLFWQASLQEKRDSDTSTEEPATRKLSVNLMPGYLAWLLIQLEVFWISCSSRYLNLSYLLLKA